MRPLPTYSVVRVRQLRRPSGDYDGWKVNRRPPQVGDIGAVVEVLTAPAMQEEMYVVECSGSDGVFVWLCSFSFDELELPTDQRPPSEADSDRRVPDASDGVGSVLMIGSRGGDHIALRPLCRSNPGATDYWDGNWLKVAVDVRTGAFRGKYVADLRVEEFRDFREQVVVLHESLKGEAALNSMEAWVSVRLAADRLGHLNAQCEVRDQPGMGSRLLFTLDLDQSFIPTMVTALDDVIRSYPLVGHPDT
jgi:hypothetical protein